eukprot:COSAG01_NODE_927_length_12693_cov_16.333810_1_plen_57_part_00
MAGCCLCSRAAAAALLGARLRMRALAAQRPIMMPGRDGEIEDEEETLRSLREAVYT